jgi:type II secretory pathway pseudopilin PulG
MGAKANQNAQQTIEELQARYQQLNKRKIQAETTLENARQQLVKLQEDARTKYGTDDVAQLREKLAAMKADNERKRAEYQSQLERIEADLAAVEQKFAATEAANERTSS